MAAVGSRDASTSRTAHVARPVALVAPFVAVPALVLVVVLALVGVPIVVAVILPVLAALALGWWVLHDADAAVVRGLALRPATETEQPRLFNMVEGLCDSHGFRRPAIFVLDDDARNALVWGCHSEQGNLAVTRGWLDAASRMGLEGLLARELDRADDPALASATVVVSLGRVVPGPLRRRLVRRVYGPHQAMLDDFAAVRYTRYPPGLADALATMAGGSTVVRGATARTAHLWVAPPVSGPTDLGEVPPVDLRVDALREL